MPGEPEVHDIVRALAMYVRRFQAIPQEDRDTMLADEASIRAARIA
jgi:hypothetical protein